MPDTVPDAIKGDADVKEDEEPKSDIGARAEGLKPEPLSEPLSKLTYKEKTPLWAVFLTCLTASCPSCFLQDDSLGTSSIGCT